MITTHITVAKSSMSLTQCSFDTLYTLYLAQFVHHGVETFGVLHVEADVAFEDAVVAVDAEGLQDVMTRLRKIKGIESVKRTLS